MRPAALLCAHSLRVLRRERVIRAIFWLVVASALAAAALGWAEAETRGLIHTRLAGVLLSKPSTNVVPGQHVPGPSLWLLRDLAPCLALSGAFAAIMIGHRCLESDRRAGLLPLIGVRMQDEFDYAAAKVAALGAAMAVLVGVVGVIGAAALLALPLPRPTPEEWARFVVFLVLGWAYLMTFATLSLAITATNPNPLLALSGACVIWFATTLLLPVLGGDCPLPVTTDTTFFARAPLTGPVGSAHWLAPIARPFALGDAFAHLARELLGEGSGRCRAPEVPPMVMLLIAPALAIAAAVRNCLRLEMC
ncbi:hypothetical protein [Rhodobacter maris]|uniref:ABC-2 type transport system permease protein n=1 Tax=Rhodobacter maris TaxID=446682 RepID=A0A285TID7_9RHOB|nr:hypothetical protein [Rhodobacter maris]SOC21767.1 hypothetical protein SAMN05877831_1252 [Rhodobacter maris]